MSLENDFLVFAGASGANVLTQSAYAAASTTPTGYVSGVASSAAVNKTLRQCSIMAAMIAQFIVDKAVQPVVDDGTIATIETNFEAAILAIADTVNIPMSQVTGLTAALAGYLPLHATADAAAKLATARNIALTGAVTGAINFDGSINVSMATTFGTIAANSLLANPTGATASPAAVTLANGLVFSGTTLGLGSITVTGMSNSGSASITGNLTVGGNATVSGNISVVGSGTPEIEMKSTGTGGHDWFLVSVGPSWGGGLSAGCLSFFDNTAGANRGYFDPSGNLNLLNFLYVNEYLISTSQYTVLANNGSNGAILLRPNGAFSATGQLELDSSGAVTINGNLTVTGTINFDTSDATLKDLGDPIEPRPFHRLPYHAYRRLDTGSRGWGPTAQGVASIAPEYTDRRTMLVGGEDRSVLFMSKQQITMDTAFWAGRQVDLLWEEIQRLRDELQAYGAH